MKIIKLKLDFLSGPVWGEFYSVERHKSVTGIKIVDNDYGVERIHNQMQDLYSSYYAFDVNGQSCTFNKEQQQKDKPKMLELLASLKARLDEINDGSYEIEDCITPEYEGL